MADQKQCKDCIRDGITTRRPAPHPGPRAEGWRPIPGYEDRYEVTRDGKVRSRDILIVDSLNRPRRCPGRILAHTIDNFGYHRVELRDGRTRKRIGVHRLVALAHLNGPKPGQSVVRHRDHNPAHNHADNLRWGTQKQNVHDTIRDGRYVNGNAIKTHCPAGHLYDGADRRGSRRCSACRREAQRRYRSKAAS